MLRITTLIGEPITNEADAEQAMDTMLHASPPTGHELQHRGGFIDAKVKCSCGGWSMPEGRHTDDFKQRIKGWLEHMRSHVKSLKTEG